MWSMKYVKKYRSLKIDLLLVLLTIVNKIIRAYHNSRGHVYQLKNLANL